MKNEEIFKNLQKLKEIYSKIPVSSNGVYDYPKQPVIVPTENGQITMKDVDYPILGRSMETGEEKLMMPEEEHLFKNTQNVFEIPQLQDGGRVKNELEETKDWWDRYINSPKYTERLKKEFPDYSDSQINNELQARKLNLKMSYPIVGEGNFKDGDNAEGFFNKIENDERMYRNIYTDVKNISEDYLFPSSRPVYLKDGSNKAVYNHELSHSVDEGGRRIPTKTVADIVNKVRGVEPVQIDEKEGQLFVKKPTNVETIEALKNVNNFYNLDSDIDVKQGAVYKDIDWRIGNDPEIYKPKFGYIGNPTELLARVQSLRQDLYNKGIHDSATEDISQETLKQYINGEYQKYENGSEMPSYLIDLLDEVKGDPNQNDDDVKNIKWLLNNIAQNNNQKSTLQYAQAGGRIKDSMGHPYNTQEISNFFKIMVNAPWYRERLKNNGYDNVNAAPKNLSVEERRNKSVDMVVNARNKNLENIHFLFDDTKPTSFKSADKTLSVNRNQVNNLKAHPRSVISHEMSHAVGNIFTVGRVNREEGDYIKSKTNVRDEYVSSPNEAKADIDTMRYNLFKVGKFNPSTGNFKTEDGKFDSSLLKLIENDYQTKRMREVYSDESLKEMFDTLAQQNNQEETLNYAQAGGEIKEDWKTKYATNPYFKDREDWGDKLNNKFPNGKNTVKQSIYAAAKHTGIDPGLLYTSAMEEGMKLALTGQDTFERRAGFTEYAKTNPKGVKEYPIDGGYFYGLNTFGDKYGQTIKRSLLPQGFKFAPYEQKDSGGNKLYTSAAFRSHDDAISAKAAMMKQVEDAMTARLNRGNVKLSTEARKFFDMVGYNMGEDKTIEMIKSYNDKGYLKNDAFLNPDFKPASWKEPYTNVQRRYQNYKILNEQGYFNDYNTQPPTAVNVDTPKNPNFQSGGMVKTDYLTKLQTLKQALEKNKR